MSNQNKRSFLYLDSQGRTLLERACLYEAMSHVLPDRVIVTDFNCVSVCYMHDLPNVTKKTNVNIGPWLSALSVEDLKLLFPHCSLRIVSNGTV